MSLESKISKNVFQGNGTTKTFSFTFRVWKEDQVLVYVGIGDETETDVTSSCSITLSENGGTVTFPTAPAVGMTIVITRNMPFIQEDQYITGARFDPHEIEDRLDQDCAERQQLLDGVERAVKVPVTSDKTPDQYMSAFWEAVKNVLASIVEAGKNIGNSTYVTATGSDTPRTLADRFGDVVNVKDFGAVGDGVTDDTEAFEKAAETGKRVFVPQGKYLVTSDVSGDFFSDGEVFTDYSKISIGCQPYIGGVRSVYVDATNGSDFNDGASVLRPVKTMARAINIANAGKSPQTTIYLLGNYVYEVPASMLVFSGVAPHVASYNGSPTLKFMYNGGVGPRFYSTHVNFKGTEDNPLKIDSAFGGLYFEGCSCTFAYTEFLTATGIMGGNITSSDCTYSTLPNAGTDFGGLGRRPALFVYMSNARIYNTTLKSTDGKSTGILFSHGSVGAVYGYLNVVEQSVSETTQPIIKTYNSSINLNFTSNALSFTNKYFRFVNLSWSTMNITSDCYNIIQQLNSIFDESNVFVGKNSVYISCFEKGQKISSGYFRTSGYITNDGARIGMTIQLPRLAMPSVKDIDVSFSKITIRGISGYIADGIDKESIGTIIATNNTYFVNVFIELSSSYQKPEINNTPVSVEMETFVLTAN